MEQKILSLKDDKITSEVELIEYPVELSGGRNLLTKTSAMYAWERVFDVSTTSGAFVYMPAPFSMVTYQVEARALDENMVGAVFSWQFSGKIQGKSIELSLSWQKAWVYYDLSNKPIGLRCDRIGQVELRNIKVEKGTIPTDWTPAPEDLGLSYPDFITEFKPSISDRYILTEELVEYPAELIGGRNLIIRSTEEKGRWINISGQVVSANNHSTSDYIPVKPNTDYMFTKSDSNLANDAGFFRWAWYDEDKNYISRQPNSSNEFLWTTPNNVHYVRISYPDDSYPKFEKGTKATPWTPAPEDLGLSYPDHIQSFGTSFSNNILINEFIEQ